MVSAYADLCLKSYDDSAPGFIDVGDLRYGLFDDVLVIRGTANAENWLRDAEAYPKRTCRGYLAHAGFVNSFQRLCVAGMLATVPTLVTGHSLGGAIATLVAEKVGCKLVTFGSPRVYFRFGSTPDMDHTRIVDEGDPVPMTPRIFYRHLNNPVRLKDNDCLIEVHDHFMQTYINRIKSLGVQ
jgi:hypothetical protein